MPRLFVGNFEFEHTLANPHFQLPDRLKRLNAELATSWFAIAEDGDYLWCPQFVPLLRPFFQRLSDEHGLPRVQPIAEWKEAPAGTELVPWGWTDPLKRFAKLHRWECAVPPLKIACDVNSRQFSYDLETEWQVGLPGASAIRDPAELKAALFRASDSSSRCVIKAQWGMSARERIIVGRKLKSNNIDWIQRRLAQQGVVFVEPWVHRLEEAGLQIHIPQLGTPQMVGITALMCDELGQYRGSWFTDLPGDEDFQQRWQPAVDTALRAAERLQDRGYFGPLGIDAMRYQLPDGSIHLRPLQDINARWTMGRLSLGWRKFLREGECGCWQHGSANDLLEFESSDWREARVLDLTPPWEPDEPARRVSRVVFLRSAHKD